jgi:acetyl esterase/lipase
MGAMQYFLSLFLFVSVAGYGQSPYPEIPLYEGPAPNSMPFDPDMQEAWDLNKRSKKTVRNVQIPTLTMFAPDPERAASDAAVIICPGGGYWSMAVEHEGWEVAQAFAAQGIRAFVLKYRLPTTKNLLIKKETGPLQDAQQAIRLLRRRAREWNIDPRKIGMVGFSAGGHLASTAGTHWQAIDGNPDTTSLRPDFMVLVYSRITLLPTSGNRNKPDGLYGGPPTEEQLRFFSNERHVTPQTPPTFMVHAADDPITGQENWQLFFDALQKNQVPVELHIYQKGGHGFGLYHENGSEKWLDRCINWLISNNFIAQPTVQISTVSHLGTEHYKINTPRATYFLEKQSGGFSSVTDPQGTDWVQYRNSGNISVPASAASDFRGIPNLVFGGEQNGIGHPGFDKCYSEQTGHNCIRTSSKNGKWQWTWTFTDSTAALDIQKVDTTRTYWFLYEGPTAGHFAPAQQFWGVNGDTTLRTDTPDFLNKTATFGHFRWVYFGQKDYPWCFFVAQPKADALEDTFSYMGTTGEGVKSPDGMNVFGFGRGHNTGPTLRGADQRFLIGFFNSATLTEMPGRADQYIARMLQSSAH